VDPDVRPSKTQKAEVDEGIPPTTHALSRVVELLRDAAENMEKIQEISLSLKRIV
jgi:hypothetical protein